MPLRIFASRALSGANLVVFCLGAAAFAMWYFVSLYLQQVLGYTPIEAGLAFLPMTVAIAICTSRSRAALDRPLRPGRVLAFGMALITVGMLGFGRVSRGRQLSRRRAGPSVVTAAGIGFSFVPVDDRGDDGRRRAGGRSRVGPRQHLPPDRRLARPRAAGDDRHAAHRGPRRPRVGSRCARRRLPARVHRGRRHRRGRHRPRAGAARARRRHASSSSVTGPSLTSSTSMCAPKTPPAASRRARKRS